MDIKFYTEDPDLDQLTKKHKEDAAFDIRTNEHSVTILARESALLGTGLYVCIPDGYVGIVKSRSGIAVKQLIEVGAGVIDSNYRGEIKVLLHNHSDDDVTFAYGDRIAQLLLLPVPEFTGVPVDALEALGDSDRGAAGFGSSGIQ